MTTMSDTSNKIRELSSWIIAEIDSRGWSIRQLARRAELSHATINDVVSGNTRPGFKFCVGIAHALNVPPEDVLRRAGLLPAIPEEVHEREELLHYFTALPADDRQRVVILARALHEQRAKYETEDK
jgi:transcriptional regulator with XRE-family HTH domain